MATIEQLYNFEPLIESASVAILSSSYGLTNVYTSMDDTVNLPYPRIEINSQKGTPTGHKFVSGSNSFYDHSFNTMLAIYIVSDRAETNVNQHRDMVTKAIVALTDNVNYIPYMDMHYIYQSNLSNQGYQMRNEADTQFDETAVTLDQIIIIKPQFF